MKINKDMPVRDATDTTLRNSNFFDNMFLGIGSIDKMEKIKEKKKRCDDAADKGCGFFGCFRKYGVVQVSCCL